MAAAAAPPARGSSSEALGGTMPRSTAMLQPHPDRPHNRIVTAKYSVLTFFPRATLELLSPFRKFANFYFFVVGLLQMVPTITLTNGLPSTWLPLIFIVGIDMFLMAREDKARHRADRETNAQPVDILSGDAEANGAAVRRATWGDVRAGDVVRIFTRESFPADILLLRGSDPPGQCWVNTKPLDGETDTKCACVALVPTISFSNRSSRTSRTWSVAGCGWLQKQQLHCSRALRRSSSCAAFSVGKCSMSRRTTR